MGMYIDDGEKKRRSYIMDKSGHSIRILCDALCILNHEGVNYQGIIENISLTGALINFKASVPVGIRPGITCGLKICSDPSICPMEYKCMVVRTDSKQIGLQFLEMTC